MFKGRMYFPNCPQQYFLLYTLFLQLAIPIKRDFSPFIYRRPDGGNILAKIETTASVLSSSAGLSYSSYSCLPSLFHHLIFLFSLFYKGLMLMTQKKVH